MEQRETAYIEALLGVHKKEQAKVIFNPAEYSLEKGNQFSSAPLPGLSNPVLSFVNGDADTLTMELFFDTYTNRGGSDVRKENFKAARDRSNYSRAAAGEVCLGTTEFSGGH
jgi:hypothetical protein